MENNFYLFSNITIDISRFHYCSWQVQKDESYLEFGFETQINCDTDSSIELLFYIPELYKKLTKKGSDKFDIALIKSLHKQLSDEENAKYIFNESVKSKNVLECSSDVQPLYQLDFQNETSLIVLPLKFGTDRGMLKVSTHIFPCCKDKKVYGRFIIPFFKTNIAEESTSFANKLWIYDIKLNERRNIPVQISNEFASEDIKFCNISAFYCFHVFPSRYEISFASPNNFQSLRILEKAPFSRYLKEVVGYKSIKAIKEKNNLIVFNKHKPKDNNSNGRSCYCQISTSCLTTKQVISAAIINVCTAILLSLNTFKAIYKAIFN